MDEVVYLGGREIKSHGNLHYVDLGDISDVTDPFQEAREFELRLIEAARPLRGSGILIDLNRPDPLPDDWIKRMIEQYGKRSRDDDLAFMWFYGEATPGSDWTREKELAKWIALSEKNVDAWRGVIRLLNCLREGGHPIPGSLVVWAIDVARGKLTQPKRKRTEKRGSPNAYRNLAILKAITFLVNEGLPATRTDAAEPTSACHVVARASDMKYGTVADIWNRRRKWLREVRQN